MSSTPSSAPAQEVRITYQDGTTVTWPGPAHGAGWTVQQAGGEGFGFVPESTWTPRVATWDRGVREGVFGTGWNEELDFHVGPDGRLSSVRSSGIYQSLSWAAGPELTGLDLDPCSQWPASATLGSSPDRSACRVLTLDGHPVVLAEGVGVSAVFCVRPDRTAVFLEQRSVGGEPVMSSEDLARAALTLPAP